ncbi:MAG: anti-sigma F factor, partial [Oscillospiraceae bacterium]
TIDLLADIKTAVSEAVTNSIVHAYRGTCGKITMSIKIMPDFRIIINIRDKGCGISNIRQAMEPCFTSAPTEERSGMGFTVMETFMDKVTVRSQEGKGTSVTMVKRLLPKDGRK